MLHEFLQKWADKTSPKIKELKQGAEDSIVTEVQKVVPRLSAKTIIFLTLLVLVFLFIGGYGVYWKFFRKDVVNPDMKPTTTQGGGVVQTGSQVPAVDKAQKKGKAKTKTETRLVATIPDEELPPEEQAKIPIIPPPTDTVAAAALDNCIVEEKPVISDHCRQKYAELYRKPALGDTQIVPPSRGDVHTRAYILPDGAIKIYQDPQKEKFWGLPWKDSNWKRLEIEGRLGLFGNTQAKGTVRWLPLRTGDIQYGPEISLGSGLDGVVRTEGMLMFRLEPFRKHYR